MKNIKTLTQCLVSRSTKNEAKLITNGLCTKEHTEGKECKL